MSLIATVQGYIKPCSKQLKFSVTLYPPYPHILRVSFMNIIHVIIYYEQNIGAFYRTFFSTRIKSTQQWPTPRAGLDRHVGPYCQVFDSMCENVLSFVCCFYSQHGESKRFILFYNDVTISTTNHSEIIVLLLYGLRCR